MAAVENNEKKFFSDISQYNRGLSKKTRILKI